MSADSPHPSADTLASYAARRLPAADVLTVSDHLAGCAVCRQALAALSDGDKPDLFDPAAVPPLEPLTYEEMTAWLDGTLDEADREIVAAKLEASPRAAAELADLTAFRRESDDLPAREYTPGSAGVGPADSDEARIITPPSWRWQRPLPWWAAAAAVLLALAVGWWLLPTRRPAADPALAHLDIGKLPGDLRREVELTARTGKLPDAHLPPELHRRDGVLASASTPATFAALGPVAVVVRTAQPTLSWSPRAEVDGYTVLVQPLSGAASVTSPPLPASATTWTPEALARGKVYEWQVEATRGGEVIDRVPKPPAAEARFLVLDAERDAALTRLEQSAGASPLVLGVAYARAGLYDDAETQFRQLARDQPDSALAARLLHDTEEMVRPQSPAPTTTHGAQ